MPRFIAIILAIACICAPTVFSQTTCPTKTVTVSWSPNSEPDIAGYIVSYGLASRQYTTTLWTTTTSQPVVICDNNTKYYFAVQAKNTAGATSVYSEEVSNVVTGPTNAELAWMQLHHITDLTADEDDDGISNHDEFLNGTDPTIPNILTIAEGCTGFFLSRLAIANPGDSDAPITVKFLREGSDPIIKQYTIPAMSRKTVRMNDIPGLEYISVSTEIVSHRGGVVVERTMSWGGANKMDSAHTGKAASKPQKTWFFAEGDARNFDTYLLLANGNSTPVEAIVTYMLDNGGVTQATHTVPANRRFTIYTNSIPSIGRTSFSMSVETNKPVSAERAMYFSTYLQWWKGGTASLGASTPSKQWFIAEGHTCNFFSEYILLANPNWNIATATIRFLLPSGNVITKLYTLPPSSRTTIFVNDINGLECTDVSASINSTLPIIVERSMYWPGRWGEWEEGHNSIGLTQTGTKWALAEGETGGPYNIASYILLANATDTDATVSITILRDNKPPITITRNVKAASRVTIYSGDITGLSSGEQFGALIESTNGVPIAVERSMYWDSSGKSWSAGTNETGFLLK